MKPVPQPIDLPNLRRLRGLALLRAITPRLDGCSESDREVLGEMLVSLATPPIESRAPAPFAFIQRSVTHLRVGGDPIGVADAALFQVARCWTRWSTKMRSEGLNVGLARWHKFADVLARDGNAAIRAGLARLAVDSMDTSLLPALHMLLGDRDRGVAEEAERAWIEIAARASGLSAAQLVGVPRIASDLPLRNALTSDEQHDVRTSLSAALRSFPEHRCRGVLLASVLLLDTRMLRLAEGDVLCDPLAAMALSREEAASGALRGFLRASKLPIVAERAMEWMAHAPLARAAVDRLSETSTPAEAGTLAQRWSLALRPCRSSLLCEVTPTPLLKPGALTPACTPNAALPESNRARLPAMLASTRTGPSERVRALEPMLLDPSPLVRHALTRHGTHRDQTDLAFDGDPRVACTGALLASLVGTGRTTESPADESQRLHVWRALARTRDVGVRRIAHGELGRITCWSTGLLGARESLRRSLAADRESTLHAIREQLATSHPSDFTPLLVAARGVGLVADLEPLLVELASRAWTETADHRRCLATLVSTLGDARGAASLDALHAARSHDDARVRANAVQALGRRARLDAWSTRRLIPTFIELKGDAQHRVRANAIRSIIEVASVDTGMTTATSTSLPSPIPTAAANAVESLVSMLTDDRSPHRLAGVWLASRTLHQPGEPHLSTRVPEIAARVMELAKFDADPSVRHRATATAERIARDTRLGWLSPTPRENGPRWAWNAA